MITSILRQKYIKLCVFENITLLIFETCTLYLIRLRNMCTLAAPSTFQIRKKKKSNVFSFFFIVWGWGRGIFRRLWMLKYYVTQKYQLIKLRPFATRFIDLHPHVNPLISTFIQIFTKNLTFQSKPSHMPY